MILGILLVFIVNSAVCCTFDEKVTIGSICDQLQQQRETTHEAKYGLFKFVYFIKVS